MQEHDATLEIMSPHCGLLQHSMQYEQETQILFTIVLFVLLRATFITG